MSIQLREFDINIDIILKNKIEEIIVVQGESKATIFNIQLTKSGIPVNLQYVEEIKIAFEDIHKNQAIMICEADINNIIKCELSDEVMNLDVGKIKMEIILTSTDYRLITKYIEFEMSRSIGYKKERNDY